MYSNKLILILPLCIISLLSCNPDSSPKIMTYDETLEYIRNNSKGVKVPKEGYVEYSSSDIPDTMVIGFLESLGVKDKSSKHGSNKIESSKISDYISKSEAPIGQVSYDLSLMYLTITNFPLFIDGDNDYSYTFTYQKELIISCNKIDYLSKRYYNSDFHLTRLEIDSSFGDIKCSATQSYLY